MNDVLAFLLILTVAVSAIVGGVTLAGLAMHRRTRLKELAYRERIAMIEKGLVPSPEMDPARFERFVRDIPEPGAGPPRGSGRANRQRSLGVMLIGLSLGVATVIAFAGNDPSTAIGVGGLIGFLGLAMLLNGLLSGHDEPEKPARRAATTPDAGAADRPSPGL